MKNLVFDVNVILDLWLERQPEDRLLLIAQLIESQKSGAAGCWIASPSLHVLEYLARQQFKKEGVEPARARQVVKRLLAHLLKNLRPLTCFGFQQDEALLAHSDLEDAQIIKAASVLHGPVAIVTNEKRFDTTGTDLVQLSPPQADLWLQDPAPLPAIAFIDLQAQQNRMRPVLEEKVHRVLHHGQYIMGPEIAELEAALAEYVGVKHSITVASGTDSLEIALRALGLGPGDEVITVPFTWISSAEIIGLVGATPVFVDIEPDSFNINVDLIEAAITPRTKAILPVSLFGQMPDYAAINAIAARHGLTVIEDGAQSFGATQQGRRSGGVTTIASTSFFPAKPLGCYGDGGALFTDDDELAEKMRAIRTHGGVRRHHHPLLGMNGRFDTLQAAVLLAKWPHFAGEVEARGRIGARYSEPLKDCCVTPGVLPGNTHVYAQYTIRVAERERVAEALKAQGIPTAVYYPKCLHEQPVFAELGYRWGDFPEAERASREVLSLPMHPGLTEREQDRVVAAVQAVVG